MRLKVESKSFPLEHPFRITGYTFETTNAVWVTLDDGEFVGRGEGVGVYYLNETVESMTGQIETIRKDIEAGTSRETLQQLLPPGGARNAIDCAIWDLEAKRSQSDVFALSGIESNSVQTVATIGIGSDEFMSMRARDFNEYQNLKIKLDAERPVERVQIVREARPDAKLIIDANQAWDRKLLESVLPELSKLGVEMIEQPVARGNDKDLTGIDSPIPLGADESCLSLSEYSGIAPYYQVINIKLDKCGGLTEALEIARMAKTDGKRLMVGNMTGTSLSMAPAFVIAQLCEFVDIDGPLLLKQDIDFGLQFQAGGWVSAPTPQLWG